MANDLYGLIKVGKDSEGVPADAPIGDLRFKTNGGWRGHENYNGKVSGGGLDALEEHGVEVVSDLEGWSESELVELDGIGEKTARRLIDAADRADVEYRGDGYPWDVTVEVEVPTEIAPTIADRPEGEISQAANEFFQRNGFFEQIEEMAIAAQVRELEERKQGIEGQIAELTGAD